eukprot:361965-Chlamydomonas_euryale.AAC.4
MAQDARYSQHGRGAVSMPSTVSTAEAQSACRVQSARQRRSQHAELQRYSQALRYGDTQAGTVGVADADPGCQIQAGWRRYSQDNRCAVSMPDAAGTMAETRSQARMHSQVSKSPLRCLPLRLPLRCLPL